MKKKKKINIRLILRVSTVVFIIGVLVWGWLLPNESTLYAPNKNEAFNDVWTQIIDDETIVLEDVSDFTKTDTGQPIVIQTIITEDMAHKAFAFYAGHQEVVISVNDEVLYERYCPEYLEFFGSPGRDWVDAHITDDMIGDTLTVSLTSDFTIYNTMPSDFYFVQESDILILQIKTLAVRNFAAIVILGLAIVTYLNAKLWHVNDMRKFLYAMADLYLFAGFWMCAEINILSTFFGMAGLSALLAMIILRIIPITYYHFCLTMIKNQTIYTKISGALVWGNFIVSMILQFVFGISLIDLIWLNTLVGIILAIRTFIVVLAQYRSREKHDKMDMALYGAFIFVIVFFIESVNYLNCVNSSKYMGFALAIAFTLYSVYMHIIIVKHESNTNVKKDELEIEYNNLNKKPLNQQINAHFMFNSLNTISAYCKEDPAKADNSVKILARYMHSYSTLVASSEYIDVEEELDLLESYMEIQNIRFEDKIKYTIINNCIDVMIPPLVLQTLVENSINHGLRNQNYLGEIKIEIKEQNNMFKIVVSDNGVGFDVKTLEATKGVGIDNLQKRVIAMGGTVTISSKVLKGTKVTMFIPKQNLDL
ncbi:MAG: histidine kinase [Clostridia bacterium]